MVAVRQDVYAHIQKFFRDIRCYARAAGRILGISDREIYLLPLFYLRQKGFHGFATGIADYIAYKEYIHRVI